MFHAITFNTLSFIVNITYLIRVVPRSYLERKAKSDTKCCGIDRHYWFFTILGGEVSKDKDLWLRYELMLFYLYYNNRIAEYP